MSDTCPAKIDEGARKGQACGRVISENGYCFRHQKYTKLNGGTPCRRFNQGCIEPVPPEFVKAGIKSCRTHLGKDISKICKEPGCLHPSEKENYCNTHFKIVAIDNNITVCSARACGNIIEDTKYKYCTNCRQKAAASMKMLRAKKTETKL